MLLQQPRFGFTFSFQDRLMPHLVALLDDCSIGNVNSKLSQIQLFFRWWRHQKCHFATLKFLIFLLKTHCRPRGWWYHVPHTNFKNHSLKITATNPRDQRVNDMPLLYNVYIFVCRDLSLAVLGQVIVYRLCPIAELLVAYGRVAQLLKPLNVLWKW